MLALPTLSNRLDRKSKRKFIRWGLIGGNVFLLLAVATFVLYNRSASHTVRSSTLNSAVTTASSVPSPLDQLSSAQIALQAARMTKLPEETAVRNQADSEDALSSVITSDASIAAKPQVVSTAQKSKHDIVTYTTKAGDTITGIATKFGIAPNSIRWSNNVSGEAIAAGKELLIPPANGIVYKVKAGDTIASITAKYQANKETFVFVNDAESGSLAVDSLVWIPNGTQTLPSLRFASSASGFSFGTAAIYGANGYDRGYCTWWASLRRTQIGRPIPSNLGNAITWKSRASAAGLGVGTKPQAGAVIWTPATRGWGHVGFVERVNEDGSVYISEMNVRGWNKVSYETLSPEAAARYWYIY